jgi:hypothetical protein
MSTENEKTEISLIGNMNFNIKLEDTGFAAQYETSNENNLIAVMMVKEMLGAVVLRNSHPLTPKKEKLKPKEFSEHVQAVNLLDKIATELATHLLISAKQGKLKVKLDKPDAPKIITLDPKL